MKNKSLVLSYAAALSVTFSFGAFADDDEMKTETKSTGGANTGPTLPADGTGKLPPPVKPPSAADHALRAKLRKRAPFWIDDTAHGAAIRLNKDGTYSSEAQGGGSIAGSWKVLKGELLLQSSDGGEKYAYPLAAGKELTIRGKKAAKGRFNLN